MTRPAVAKTTPPARPTDPLEAAKADAGALLAPPPLQQVAEELPPPTPATTISIPMPYRAASAPPQMSDAPQFRVVKTKRVSINGLLTQLNEGQIISTDGYSPAVIESMRAQGVQLVPIQEPQ